MCGSSAMAPRRHHSSPLLMVKRKMTRRSRCRVLWYPSPRTLATMASRSTATCTSCHKVEEGCTSPEPCTGCRTMRWASGTSMLAKPAPMPRRLGIRWRSMTLGRGPAGSRPNWASPTFSMRCQGSRSRPTCRRRSWGRRSWCISRTASASRAAGSRRTWRAPMPPARTSPSTRAWPTPPAGSSRRAAVGPIRAWSPLWPSCWCSRSCASPPPASGAARTSARRTRPPRSPRRREASGRGGASRRQRSASASRQGAARQAHLAR